MNRKVLEAIRESLTAPDGGSVGTADVVRLAIATYILGQMMNQATSTKLGDDVKSAKVRAAYEYADLILKG